MSNKQYKTHSPLPYRLVPGLEHTKYPIVYSPLCGVSTVRTYPIISHTPAQVDCKSCLTILARIKAHQKRQESRKEKE
jgi:hypothetical protein